MAFNLAGAGMLVVLSGGNAGSLEVLNTGHMLLGWGFGGFVSLQETIWGSYFGRRSAIVLLIRRPTKPTLLEVLIRRPTVLSAR